MEDLWLLKVAAGVTLLGVALIGGWMGGEEGDFGGLTQVEYPESPGEHPQTGGGFFLPGTSCSSSHGSSRLESPSSASPTRRTFGAFGARPGWWGSANGSRVG